MWVRYFTKIENIILRRTSQQIFINRRISNEPLVVVKQGKLKGAVHKSADGNTYYSFKGIPYAQPPVGKLRFKAPLPALPWKETYSATKHGPVCPQMDMVTMEIIPGDENCLFLNIYSKKLTNTKQPVIVFIHGGGFLSGSGNSDLYGPEYLIQHDVVLVTINYRLEALGFLCLETEDVPGNAGMKDQVAALKWVKENITSFGGDPDNITLMGESAGGAAVTYHMVSPMSQNLFHKAIVQSGVSISDWAIGLDSKERAKRVAKSLGKDAENDVELLNFLQSVPATDLAKVTFKTMLPEEKFRGLPLHFCPVVEKKYPNVKQFLTEESIKLLLSNKFRDIPMIIGYNNGEGIIMLREFIRKIDIFNNELEMKIPREISSKVSNDKLKSFGAKLKEFYFGGKALSEEFKYEMAKLESDRHFIYNCFRFTNIYMKNAKSPVFMYRFAYDSVLNLMKTVTGTDFKGAVHADDLFYLFSTDMTKELVDEAGHTRDMINEVTKLWTNFAKTGNPTPDDSFGVRWLPFTNKSKHFLNIKTPLSLEQNADQETVDFWNKLYSEAGLPCITKSNL